MSKLVYREDKHKVRRSALKFAVIGAAMMMAGAIARSFTQGIDPTGPDLYRYAILTTVRTASSIGLIGFIVCGGILLLMGIFLQVMSKRRLDDLISADENGVTLGVVFISLPTKKPKPERPFIPWQNIREIVPVRKHKTSCVVFVLHDPEAFISTVDPRLKRTLKGSMKNFGSPAAVIVDYCAESSEQIASELNRLFKDASTLSY